MKTLLLTVVLLSTSLSHAQTAEDQRVFGLKLTRSDIPRLCTLCNAEVLSRDADMQGRDTVTIPYALANIPGSLRVIFDANNVHRESLWLRKDKDDFINGRPTIALTLSAMYGLTSEHDSQRGVKILRWNREEVTTSFFMVESVEDLCVYSYLNNGEDVN